MKSLTILLAIASIASSSILMSSEAPTVNVAPPGCKPLSTDSDFPNDAAWKAALPGVIREKRAAGKTSPDYRFRAKSIEDVRRAVKFAGQHNVRLAIISTGQLYSFLNIYPIHPNRQTVKLTCRRPRFPDTKRCRIRLVARYVQDDVRKGPGVVYSNNQWRAESDGQSQHYLSSAWQASGGYLWRSNWHPGSQ
jgi:hypothetical protein